jgi:DMSO/TMAO reductase YedYZ molybdopterin-dependent catalytic subunit
VTTTSETPPAWTGALSGLLAATAGLAAAELLGGAVRSERSPVVSVGDRVVDLVPRPVKEWAISTFGTNDKAVLLGGVLVLLAASAAVVGVVAQRRGRTAGLVGVGLFTAVGVVASLGRGGGGWAVVASLLAGVVAGLVLFRLLRRTRPAPGTEVGASGGVVDRRGFLVASGVVAATSLAAAAAGRWLREQGAAAAQRLKIVLPKARQPLPAVDPAVAVDVPGVSPFLTPNDRFYRIDTALAVPQVDVETWTLKVSGMVRTPITLTWDELLARPMVEADVTIACVSNEVGGDLVGTARWLGCRLDDLLAEAGVDPRADQVVGRSVDGFTAGFPTAVLDGRDALVAIGMNGEPLPVAHGFPARLIVPGLYGYVSATKWLSEIALTTFDSFEGYWIPRGWSVEGPVKTQSRIDTPRTGKQLPAGTPVAVAGVAWAPVRGIAKVEVQVDDGPWQEARLGAEHARTTWRQWVWDWTPTAGEHRLQVRATDGTGATQPEQRTPVAPDGATGWDSITVSVS